MFESPKWPVVILSNYRTGSTAYAMALANYNQCPYFTEPWTPKIPQLPQMDPKYTAMIDKGDTNFVVKFMPDQINAVSKYATMLVSPDSFKIKLTRRDILSQIASRYIAFKTATWWQTYATMKSSSYVVDSTDTATMLDQIRIITANKYFIDNLNIVFDKEIAYEDLGIITGGAHIKIRPPENIDEIKEKIARLLWQLNYQY